MNSQFSSSWAQEDMARGSEAGHQGTVLELGLLQKDLVEQRPEASTLRTILGPSASGEEEQRGPRVRVRQDHSSPASLLVAVRSPGVQKRKQDEQQQQEGFENSELKWDWAKPKMNVKYLCWQRETYKDPRLICHQAGWYLSVRKLQRVISESYVFANRDHSMSLLSQ